MAARGSSCEPALGVVLKAITSAVAPSNRAMRDRACSIRRTLTWTSYIFGGGGLPRWKSRNSFSVSRIAWLNLSLLTSRSGSSGFGPRPGHANRLHKVLDDAGLKLASVASRLLGASGRAMLEARGTALSR
jgi:hypothetical protein